MRHAAIAAAICAFAAPAFAQDCVGNFQVGKNKAGGASYSAVAQLPGKNVEQAYLLSQQVVGQEGWKVYQTFPAQYAGFARNSQTTASGKTGELTFTTAVGNDGMILAIVYDNPPGVNSPERAVKDHFCKIAESLRKQIAAAPAAAPATHVASGRVSGSNAAVVETPATGKLCLAGACLGMTVAEASKLKLDAAPSTLVQFGPNVAAFGRAVSADGRQIKMTDGGWFDSKSMAAFAKGVSTICELRSGPAARMKASDGLPITMHFSPTIRDGKGTLILTKIERALPGMSDADYKQFEDKAAAQFGSAYVYGSKAPPSDRPYAQVYGPKLTLALPYEPMGDRLMATPGCSTKASLD